jgi:hypothetical protein
MLVWFLVDRDNCISGLSIGIRNCFVQELAIMEEIMKLKLEIGKYLCCTPTFVINGIQADTHDFGEKFDRSPETGEEYGCGDMQFTAIPPTLEVLTKYGISNIEYTLIADQLQKGLSFGQCSLCVEVG